MLDQWKQTPLSSAAAHGDVLSLKLLIAAGADLDTCDIYGQNALSKALDFGHAEVARELLNAGARCPLWYLNWPA